MPVIGKRLGIVLGPELERRLVEAGCGRKRREREGAVACTPERLRRDLLEVARQLAERDERDSSRTASPLQAAADAFHINTGGLLPEEVVDVMVAEIRQRSDRT